MRKYFHSLKTSLSHGPNFMMPSALMLFLQTSELCRRRRIDSLNDGILINKYLMANENCKSNDMSVGDEQSLGRVGLILARE